MSKPKQNHNIADMRELIATARPCGCTGDPTGYEPPRRHPDCHIHAHRTRELEDDECRDCAGYGEVPVGYTPEGTALVGRCPCGGTPHSRRPGYRRLTLGQIAAGCGARATAAEKHAWRRDTFGALAPQTEDRA